MDEMKKYIIEFSEDPHTIRLMKIKNGDKFPTTEFKAVKPYIEPDLEQVRKEAYEKGFDAGRTLNTGKYEKGLNDAWDAARKIVDMYSEVRRKIFGENLIQRIQSIYSASEAIEKIRQYEQRQEEQIQVGDEVATVLGEAVVVGVGPVHLAYVYAEGSTGSDKVKNVKKTGRHFPEISEVLKKMREGEQNDPD